MGVSNLLGKLFGNDANKNEALLRAYGKLPMYAEYRRLEVAPGTPTAFSQWLDAGRLAWFKSPTKTDDAHTHASRLLIGLPDTREAIVASLWDSRDSLGRVFPFSFFIVCPNDALGGNALERWVSVMSIHQAFEAHYHELCKLGSGGNFYKLFQKRSVALRPDNMSEGVAWLESKAREITAQDWFSKTIGDNGPAPGAWFAGLLRRAERWKAMPAIAGELALQVPLANETSYDGQIAAWLRWMEPATSRAGKPIWIILPAESKPDRAASVITRNLLPDDFQLMTTNAGNYDFVEKLSGMPQASEETSIPAEVPTDGSLYDWLGNHPA